MTVKNMILKKFEDEWSKIMVIKMQEKFGYTHAFKISFDYEKQKRTIEWGDVDISTTMQKKWKHYAEGLNDSLSAMLIMLKEIKT
jgi:hypothetical protein